MSRTRVTVLAPATIANIGPGFDTLGVALERPSDRLVAVRTTRPGVQLAVRGSASGLPKRLADNVAAHVARLVLDELRPGFGVRLVLTKGLPVGSGLGSSAASSVAAAVALNALLPRPLERAALLRF